MTRLAHENLKSQNFLSNELELFSKTAITETLNVSFKLKISEMFRCTSNELNQGKQYKASKNIVTD